MDPLGGVSLFALGACMGFVFGFVVRGLISND